LAFRSLSLALRGLGIVALWSSSPAAPAWAQDLSGTASDAPATDVLSSTLPNPARASVTSKRVQRTARTSQIGDAEVGQRLEQNDLTPNLTPTQRINNRIQNRIENRISNRIDRTQDADTDAPVSYEIATARVRKANEPLRTNSPTP
jgi:hypothetical protein